MVAGIIIFPETRECSRPVMSVDHDLEIFPENTTDKYLATGLGLKVDPSLIEIVNVQCAGEASNYEVPDDQRTA
ncbi:hypothetical protein EZMO1_3278 [Endozoicomonas montiporae CL-33]|uniref:Uncharacterized protein n=2 Tax=Endozoicomonas montiporae TaxID=1027273 RepID=A0A142BEV1_9GAMM|nr:hypothetical protein EZMO1_3278 [Endozoicomonas montiporae CL-33]